MNTLKDNINFRDRSTEEKINFNRETIMYSMIQNDILSYSLSKNIK